MTLKIDIYNERHNPAIDEFTVNRLELVVGRFHARLGHIEVRLLDENASKGGVDKTCKLDAALIPRGTLHVHATEADMHEAILKAVHRLETVVAKAVDRGHRSDAIRHRQGGLRHDSERIANDASVES